MGGSSGPLGVRAAGALDGELAYLLAPTLRKHTLFTGGALDPTGAAELTDLAALWSSPAHAEGWTALLEAAAKAVRALIVSTPTPHEIVVSGRLARLPELVAALARCLPTSPRCSRSSRSGERGRARCRVACRRLAGGSMPPGRTLRLRESSGTALDHLRVAGAESISLG